MQHVFDGAKANTFTGILDILQSICVGDVSVYEKVDGYALSISYVNGQLVVARNKSHYAGYGVNALDYAGLVDRYSDGGKVSETFLSAYIELANVFDMIGYDTLNAIFKNGQCFLDIEIVNSESCNLLQYTKDFIVLHRLVTYDANGLILNVDKRIGDVVLDLIDSVAYTPLKYEIQKNRPIDVDTFSLKRYIKTHFDMVSLLVSSVGLGLENTVEDYYYESWKRYIIQHGIDGIDSVTMDGLLRRWVFGDKSYRIDKKVIANSDVFEWARTVDKDKSAFASVKKPVQDVFRKIGYDILKHCDGYFSKFVDLDSTRKLIDASVNVLGAAGGYDVLVSDVRGIDVLPIEGLVIDVENRDVKVTGYYPVFNTIVNLSKKM